jgi:hypothetical protein
MKRFIVIGLLLAGCTKPSGTAAPQVSAGDPEIVVAGSDYRTGTLSSVRIKDGARGAETPVHSDAIVRVFGGKRYVVNRLGQDNVQIVSREGQTLSQFSVGRGLNPQDIAVTDDQTAYVSRFRSRTLLKVRLPEGEDVGNGVDFSVLADGDGYPETTWMRLEGEKLFVVVQRLDTANGFVPTDASYVCVVDTRSDELTASIKLRHVNPVTAVKKGPEGELLVGCAGKTGMVSALDGAIERLDPVAGTSSEVLSEAALGGDLIDFEILSKDRGVAIVSSGSITKLVAFDPRRGTFDKTWATSPGYHLQQLLWDGTTLWVADRNPLAPGVRRFDASGEEAALFPLTLPPYQMELSL